MTCQLTKEVIDGMSAPVIIARRYDDAGVVNLVGIFDLTDATKIDWLLGPKRTVESIKAANLFRTEEQLNHFLDNFYRYV